MLLADCVQLGVVCQVGFNSALMLVPLNGRCCLVRHLCLADFRLSLKDLFFQIPNLRQEGVLFARFQIVCDSLNFFEIFVAPIPYLLKVIFVLVVVDLGLVG